MNKERPSSNKSLSIFDWRYSLRWRLIITLGVIIIIMLLGISLGVFAYIRLTEERLWQDRQQEVTGLAASVVSEFLTRELQGLLLLGTLESDDLTPQVMDSFIELSPDLLEIIRLDEKGTILASVYQDAPLMANLFTISQSAWFLESRAGGQYLSEIELSTAGEPYLIVSVPASDDGVMAARLSGEVLWQLVLQLQSGETGQAYLINQDGLIVAHTNKDYAESHTSLKDEPNFAGLMEALNSEWQGSYINLDGEQVEGIISPIKGSQWRVVTEVTTAETTTTSRTALIILGGGIVFMGLLLTLLTGIIVERTIIRPLRQLQAGANRLGQGDVQHKLEIHQKDELGQLAMTFNQMATEIQSIYDTLENRVTERTHRLELAAVMSERLTGILDLDGLLLDLVNQVKQTFGYYHAHVYLLDRRQEELIVAAGTDKAGAEMKARGHSIPLNAPISLVAQTARTQEVIIVNDVAQIENWLPNPLLPNTKAELVVPIILEGGLVGVLDIQDNETEGLDESDVSTLRLLANQVAIAIRNAQQFAEVEESLKRAQAAQDRYLGQAWASSQLEQQEAEYIYKRSDSVDLSEELLASMEAKVFDQAQASVEILDDETTPKSLLAPVSIGNKTIGVLQAYNTDHADPEQLWNEDDLALVEAVLDQVAQTAENLRLFEETQERASREQLITQVTNKMRRAHNIEALMNITASEIKDALGIARTFIHLGNTDDQEKNASNGVEKASNDKPSNPLSTNADSVLNTNSHSQGQTNA